MSDLQDLQDNLPTANTSSSSSGKNHEGVKSYTTIMGFCIEDQIAVVCADSQMNHNGKVLSDEAKTIAKVLKHIAIVGSGNQPIFDDVIKHLNDLDLKVAMIVTVKDAARCIQIVAQRCVKNNMKINPDDEHVVDYIVIGKMANKLEMYRIHNARDYRHVDYLKASTRIMNGGSGRSALEAYQKKNKKDGVWVKEVEAIEYCFNCMKNALKEDRPSSGSIIMYSINKDDDEGLKPHAFPVSDVYGHMLETDEDKARLLVNK